MLQTAEKLVGNLFELGHSVTFPSDKCPVCGKRYTTYKALKTHILLKHPESFAVEGQPDNSVDHTQQYCFQLVKFLLLNRCLTHAIKAGNGEQLSLLMKHFTLYFKQLGYKNYALACFEHVAQIQMFLSPQTRELVMHECFVNDRGGKMANKAMDLDLEHQNRFFKQHFTLHSKEPSPKVLDRLSKSQDELQSVLERYVQQFSIKSYSAIRHANPEVYKGDVTIIKQYLRSRDIFTNRPGRSPTSTKVKEAAHNPLLLIDMYNLRDWMRTCLTRMVDQRIYK